MRAPTERFSDRVADYVRYRPSYPQEVIDLIVNTVGITRDTLIADIGCGTGIFSKLLLQTPASVIGVEPNQAMLDAAMHDLGQENRFFPVHKTAEQTGLQSHTIDAVTAAQAFHWFNQELARDEFRRILKPEGWVFLVWNERKNTGSEFAELYESVLRDCSTEYAKVGHRNTPDQTILDWFENPEATTERFPNAQTMDLEGFLGRVYSSSYVPAAGTPEREAIAERLIDLFNRCQQHGRIELDYETKVFFGKLSSSA